MAKGVCKRMHYCLKAAQYQDFAIAPHSSLSLSDRLRKHRFSFQLLPPHPQQPRALLPEVLHDGLHLLLAPLLSRQPPSPAFSPAYLHPATAP